MYLDPALGPGQHGELGGGAIFQTAIYQLEEQLPQVDKCAWNLAVGINLALAPRNCHLTAQGTASHASFGVLGTTPSRTIWPFITWDVPLTNGSGGLACGRHPLNGGDGVVKTRYTPLAGAAFAHEWRCGAAQTSSTAQACSGILGTNTVALAYPTPTGVSVAMSGHRSPTYTLPDGHFLGASSECCVNPCCDTATP